MSFDNCVYLCKIITPIKIPIIYITLESFPVHFFSKSPHFSLPRQYWFCFLWPYISFVSPYTWNHTVCILLYQAYFTPYNIFRFIHFVLYIVVSFNCWVVFHCIYTQLFVYPFPCWWTVGLILDFEYHTLSCHEHSYVSSFCEYIFSFSWSGIARSQEKCIFNFIGQIVFQSDYNIPYSHQQ